MSVFHSLGSSAMLAYCKAKATESPIEGLMMAAMANSKRLILVMEGKANGAGYFVYPQKEVGPYRADFLIHAVGFNGSGRVWPPNREFMVAVECDGADYHTSPEDRAHDRARDKYFQSIGIRTLRFTGSEIFSLQNMLGREIEIYLDNLFLEREENV